MGDAKVRQDSLLELKDVHVSFNTGRGRRLHAVSGVDLELKRGETLGLVGESGCGKSSLARAILQLPPPTMGKVLLAGVDLTTLEKEKLRSVRPRMQMVFQDPLSSLNPGRRIGRSVSAPLRILGMRDPSTILSRANQGLNDVGMDPACFANRYPRQLSGGQCQRVSIARALMSQPDLLICDEPVSALDVSVQAQILNLLDEMKEAYGLTMLFISHDLAVVKKVSDRVAVMYLGSICELATADSLYRRPAHPYTAALLNAIPEPDPAKRIDDEFLLSGELPSPINPPSGCRFRTRCPRTKTRCAALKPHLRELEDGHLVACHYPLWGEDGIICEVRQPPKVEPAKPPKKKRRFFMSLVAAAALVGAVSFGPSLYHQISFVETTDNAYAQTEMTTVSAKVMGYAGSVEVGENEVVEANQPLVRIEDREYRIRVSQVRAELLQVAADSEVLLKKGFSLQAKTKKVQAFIASATAEQERATASYRRCKDLMAKNAVAAQELETALSSSRKADASVEAAVAELEEIKCEQEVLVAQINQLDTLKATIEHKLSLREKELADTLILAPSRGIVGNITVRKGQYVRPGESLLTVVPIENVWVVANFKEVQLEKMKVGQVAQVEVDAFPDTMLEGLVESFSPATGSEFSILPPQNATGNFTKIVQRVPVKIRLGNSHPLIGHLRPGMSVVVSVDTSASPVEGGFASSQ